MLCFQGILDELAEITFSRCSGSGDTYEWNTVFGIRNDSYYTIGSLLSNIICLVFKILRGFMTLFLAISGNPLVRISG